MRRADGTLPGLAAGRRQPGDARLHGAQAGVGGQARARDLRQGRERAAAQGLAAPEAHRRQGRRDVRRRRHTVARRRAPRLVARAAGGHRAEPRPHAAPGRRQCRFGHAAAGAGPGLGAVRQGGGGRRRGRQRRQRGRHRRGEAGCGLPVARHQRRDVRRHRQVPPEPGFGRACLLPRRAEPLAPDERHAVGREFAGLGDKVAEGRRRSRAAGAGRSAERRRARRRARLPALPQRRAHAAQRRGGAGPVLRPEPRHRRGTPGLGRDRGRELLDVRRAVGPAGRRHDGGRP